MLEMMEAQTHYAEYATMQMYLLVEHNTMPSMLDDVSVRTTVGLFHTASISNAAPETTSYPAFSKGSVGFRG
jgi:hypothetical protein